MARWEVDGALELGLKGVDRVIVRADGGSVHVEGSDGWTRCHVERAGGRPIEVAFEGATLRIMHPAPVWDGSPVTDGEHEAEIMLTVPPHTEVDVEARTGTVTMSGLAEPARVRTAPLPQPVRIAS